MKIAVKVKMCFSNFMIGSHGNGSNVIGIGRIGSCVNVIS